MDCDKEVKDGDRLTVVECDSEVSGKNYKYIAISLASLILKPLSVLWIQD